MYVYNIHTAFTDSTQQRAIIYNTGLSSFTSGGTPLIRQEQILVVGHELGHNWGSHHDPGKCKNGYLMNEFAQDGAKSTHSVSFNLTICNTFSFNLTICNAFPLSMFLPPSDVFYLQPNQYWASSGSEGPMFHGYRHGVLYLS